MSHFPFTLFYFLETLYSSLYDIYIIKYVYFCIRRKRISFAFKYILFLNSDSVNRKIFSEIFTFILSTVKKFLQKMQIHTYYIRWFYMGKIKNITLYGILFCLLNIQKISFNQIKDEYALKIYFIAKKSFLFKS